MAHTQGQGGDVALKRQEKYFVLTEYLPIVRNASLAHSQGFGEDAAVKSASIGQLP